MKTKKKINKWNKLLDDAQIIIIPNGFFDEVIVRFGEGVRGQEKILHRGQFIKQGELEEFIEKEGKKEIAKEMFFELQKLKVSSPIETPTIEIIEIMQHYLITNYGFKL